MTQASLVWQGVVLAVYKIMLDNVTSNFKLGRIFVDDAENTLFPVTDSGGPRPPSPHRSYTKKLFRLCTVDPECIGCSDMRKATWSRVDLLQRQSELCFSSALCAEEAQYVQP